MQHSQDASPPSIRRQVVPREKLERPRRQIRRDRLMFLIFLVCFMLVVLLMAMG